MPIRFLHDRVQEAAYSLIPAASRAAAHLRIGRLLAAHTPSEKREEAIFEIVNQLNRGAALITAREEQEQLAEFNLIAGKRAKGSTAYASALTYLTAGAALLAEDCWDRLYELAFALEFHRAECEFLTGDVEAAEQGLDVPVGREPPTSSTALRSAACAWMSTRLSISVAPSRSGSSASATSVSNGRRTRPQTKRGANTRASGRSSEAARSRRASTCR